jgi:hypothetical protein
MRRRPFEETYHVHSYHHPRYTPGHWVRVHESICQLHPLSPAAGRVVRTGWATYASSDDPQLQQMIDEQERMRPYWTYVPVMVDGRIWRIEEEYVEFLD